MTALNRMDIAAAIDAHQPPQWGDARRAGRNPNYPYIPIVVTSHDNGWNRTTAVIRGYAFATRDEAVQFARDTVHHRRQKLIDQLLKPNQRAHRTRYGLPADLDRTEPTP